MRKFYIPMIVLLLLLVGIKGTPCYWLEPTQSIDIPLESNTNTGNNGDKSMPIGVSLNSNEILLTFSTAAGNVVIAITDINNQTVYYNTIDVTTAPTVFSGIYIYNSGTYTITLTIGGTDYVGNFVI